MASSTVPTTTDTVRSLNEQAQAFLPEAADQRPSKFLSLAPQTSASYPQPKKSLAVDAIVKSEVKRRSSSLSSDGTKSAAGLRFLKLSPVHWGEHLDGNQDDWNEVAVE